MTELENLKMFLVGLAFSNKVYIMILVAVRIKEIRDFCD
jgi:hypothetical protein